MQLKAKIDRLLFVLGHCTMLLSITVTEIKGFTTGTRIYIESEADQTYNIQIFCLKKLELRNMRGRAIFSNRQFYMGEQQSAMGATP